MSQPDVVSRTHRIRAPDGRTGTAFMLDIDGRQYIITAKHLVQESISPLHVFWEKGWRLLPVGLVGLCGFPHGLSTPLSNERGHVALVKKGFVSGFFGAALDSGESSVPIDAHNNHGFSGGPVISIRSRDYKAAGVIASYRYSYQKVYGAESSGEIDENIVVGYLPENTGIILAYNIKPALDIIAKNPIGLSLDPSA